MIFLKTKQEVDTPVTIVMEDGDGVMLGSAKLHDSDIGEGGLYRVTVTLTFYQYALEGSFIYEPRENRGDRFRPKRPSHP